MGKTKLKPIEETVIEEEVIETPETVETESLEEVVEETAAPVKKTDTKAKKATEKDDKKESKRSKKYLESLEKIDRSKLYPIEEAIEAAKSASYSKFGGSIEIHINTSIKNIRGLVSLPFKSGKALKIIAFGTGAAESGADITGTDEEFAKIEKGKLGFDVIIATPDWMPRLARVAKILGPRGLMPNPKNGTVSSDLKKVVTELQSGKIEYKTEKAANVIHLNIGGVNQPTNELHQNIKLLLTTIGKSKLKKVVLSPTMGPSVRVDTKGL